MIRKRDEFVVQVEAAGSFVQSIHDNPDRSDFLCIPPTLMQRVQKKKRAEALPAMRLADRQSAEERCRNQRIAWQPFRDFTGQSIEVDAKCGKRVIAKDRSALIGKNEWSRHSAFGVLTRSAEKIIIKFRDAAPKSSALVGWAERLDPPFRPRRPSHRLPIVSRYFLAARRSTGPGAGGLTMA